MSLMLLATLKIVSCLKNYCYHHHDNTHIVKLLCLPQSLHENVLSEFEYQLQLEFDICIESTINDKFPNEFWSKVMKFQSNTVRWKWRYMTTPPITIYWQFLKQTLNCIIPFFSWVCCIRLEWSTSSAMYCVTISPHFSNKQVYTLCVPSVWQKLETIYQ